MIQKTKSKAKKYVLTHIANYELIDTKTFNLLSQAFDYGAKIYKEGNLISIDATNCEIGEIDSWIYENGKWQAWNICGQF